MIDFGPWPHFAQDERDAVDGVLAGGHVNYWTGQEGRTFEREFADACGSAHAVAVMNGTVAIEGALAALGIGPGDEVITSSRTFIASASAAVMRGATPVIADVDRDSQNLTAATVGPLITPRTRAIIAVHLAGWPCEMDALLALAAERGIAVIEDCAQAVGAEYRGRKVGALGKAGAFSFCQDKIMTTGGEGGMLVTDDEALWSRVWSLKDHGKDFDTVHRDDHSPGFRWLHETFGTNWRMTEMQSAIGRVQLRKLEQWLDTRATNARVLADGFAALSALRVPQPPSHVRHAWYKFYAFVEPAALKAGWNRDRIMAEVTAGGVPCYSGSCSEIYLEKAFTRAGLGPESRLPVARELGETSLMFLVHPTNSARAMQRTVEVVAEVAQRALR